MTGNIMREIGERLDKGEKVALITITDKEKGTPGLPGQMMAVFADGTIRGTVGGGSAEYYLLQRGLEAIKKNEMTFTFEFDLGERGMTCGGKIKGMGNVLGVGKRLVLFGGGHVAQCIFPLAKSMGFYVTVIEDREEFRDAFTEGEYLACKPEELDGKLTFDEETYIVICTRGHALDFEALSYCIDKTYAYLGMIGSVKKVKFVFEKMAEAGYDQQYLEQVYAPVGLDISDGTPKEIAVSVMAEILKVKNKGSLSHMKDRIKDNIPK